MFTTSEAQLKKLGALITTKEIAQQPELWEETALIYQQYQAKLAEFITSFVLKENQKLRVIFTGAGTSQYVGDTLVPYLRQVGDSSLFSFESLATTDIVASPKDYLLPNEPTLLVSFARSGNSPESKATVQLATRLVKNIKHLIITCAPEGELAKFGNSDPDSLVVLMPQCSNDKGFAMTGSFSCMVLAGLLFFDQTTPAQKLAYVAKCASLGREVLTNEAKIKDLVDLDFERIVYLGSGSLSGLAREAQLKILELTHGQIATSFDSSMGFRHGPKSFITDKTLVLGFVGNDAYTKQYDLDVLNEIFHDQIAKKTVAVGQLADIPFAGTKIALTSDELLPAGYLALPDVMVAQTVALLTAVKLKNTPDTPSPTGTVNRVVEGVVIHEFN
ncbi:SIS domain-containing protein [Ligilactobacillus apodemi]|uniref:AgaS protein n=1 Tax=Ligilactobacillus apodemi DSM 16634 = JCM 16172 TaxID=1423724 RepID=A0A0R1TU48_9LACO|nr:SIS domain-containing protein [Ligilactobacillus apodemi]KRL84765.1 agaS protein [Ligilactobacillus apodemi DSM 16634 = JCM 16172]